MSLIIERYKRYLKYLNYSKNTISLYSTDVEEFERFLLQYDSLRLDEASKEEVLQYLYFINEKENKSRTKKHKICALKSFYKWYIKINPIENPIKSLNPFKIPRSLPKHLNIEQAQALQNAYNNPKYNFIIRFFLATGLRLNEVCNIKLCDIDMLNSQIKVVTKGNNQRAIYFNDKIKKRLKTYCRDYKPEVFLFESKKGKNYSKRGMQQIVANAYKMIGLEGFGVHSLRHTTATILYETTKDILVVKEFLGHKSIESTQIYTHISNESLKNAVERNPLNIE